MTDEQKRPRRSIPTEVFGKEKEPVIVEIKLPGIGTVSKSKVFAPLENVKAAIRSALESL